MTSGRAMCLAVSLSPDRIMIVGGADLGEDSGVGARDSVEECFAV